MASMASGQVAICKRPEDSTGAVSSLVLMRAHAAALSTSGPTPVSSSSARSTPVASRAASGSLQHVSRGMSGEKSAGTAQVRSTMRVGRQDQRRPLSEDVGIAFRA